MYVLVWYVPESHLESVKEAVFATGAGSFEDYAKCCWQCPGEGQFLPLSGSSPFVGSEGALTRIKEYKVELVVEECHAVAAVEALLAAHPYERPAYHLIPVLEMNNT